MASSNGSRVERRPPGAGDAVATGVLFVILGLSAVVAFFVSALFVMSTDGCTSSCTVAVNRAVQTSLVLGWGGIAVGVLGAIIGSVLAASHGRPKWPWPLLGVGVIVFGVLIGGALVDAAM